MAAISVTKADVRPLPGAIVQRLVAAEALTCGQVVYIDTAGKAALADADALATAVVFGIVVGVSKFGATDAVAGDMVDVVTHGGVTGFASMTIGTLVYLSVTAGAMDQTAVAGSSGDFVVMVGIALTAATVYVNPYLPAIVAA